MMPQLKISRQDVFVTPMLGIFPLQLSIYIGFLYAFIHLIPSTIFLHVPLPHNSTFESPTRPFALVQLVSDKPYQRLT